MAIRTDNAEPTLARRYDFGGGELLPAVTRGTDGALVAEGPAVHEGTLAYPQPDGSVRIELVTLDAVNDTVRTIPFAPLTLGHPEAGFVALDTSESLSVGGVGGDPETVMEEAIGGFAKVKVVIRRQDAVDAFNSGTRRLSCGYEVTLDETPGEHPIFGRYDARQIGRKVNHLALVEDGRDDRAFLRADSADAAGTWAAPPKPAAKTRTDKGTRMDPKLAALLTKLGVQNLDSQEDAVSTGGVKLDALLTERDDLKLKVDQFPPPEEEKEDAPDLVAENKALKAENEALKAAAAKKDEEEEEMKADAALEALVPIADRLKVKHDGLSLADLRVAVAKTRVDSVDANTPAGTLDGILAVIALDKAPASDPKRWDQSDKGSRADGADSNTRADAADKASDYYDPALARIDARRTAAGATQ